jgi:hypothetical protein
MTLILTSRTDSPDTAAQFGTGCHSTAVLGTRSHRASRLDSSRLFCVVRMGLRSGLGGLLRQSPVSPD